MHPTAFLTTLLFSLSAAARGLPSPPSHPAAANMVHAPDSFPITEPCIALSSYQTELKTTRTSLTTKKSSMQALELKQKLCHGCLSHDEVNTHGKLDWDVQQLAKVEEGQVEAVKCLEWMCGAGGGKDGHEVKKGGEMLKECAVLE